MTDPLSEIITLLRPRTVFAKGISGAGRWGVRYEAFGQPSFSAVLEGRCRLAVDGEAPITLETGDFVLLPVTPGFVLSGFDPIAPRHIEPTLSATPMEDLRHGKQTGPRDVHLLGGYFIFNSPDAPLLVSLLPRVLHVSSAGRLATLTELVAEETRAERAGRDLILTRLVEVLLVEALRAQSSESAPPGVLRGLGDTRIASAIRAMHQQPADDWTVIKLAKVAALSRSAFFERFTRAVGLSPMDYLLSWRMALAKDLLQRRDFSIEDVAERVGYGSASTFSTAFSRHVGTPPRRFAKENARS